MRAVCAELKGEEGELDGMRFDIVTACSLSPYSSTLKNAN